MSTDTRKATLLDTPFEYNATTIVVTPQWDGKKALLCDAMGVYHCRYTPNSVFECVFT